MTYHIHEVYGAEACPACTPALVPVPAAVSAGRYRRRLSDRLEQAIYLHIKSQTAIYQHETYNMALRLAAFLWGCDVAPVAVAVAVHEGKRDGTRASRAALRRVEKMHGGENVGEKTP